MQSILKRISLIIVTFNGDDVLKDCLDSIVNVYGGLPETVIVDNANSNRTAHLVARYANARYVPLPENRGFAGGNTAALPFCTKEFLVLLNNDTKLQGDSISPLIEFLDAHPQAAAAQGKVVLACNHRLDGCGGFLNPLGTLAFRGAFVPDEPKYDIPERVFTIGGAFFATRRNVLDKCGGLFYDHFKSYYEEIDYCHRLAIAGYDCWYVPTIPVLHQHSVTSNKFKRSDILRQYYRNIWFSFQTCFGPLCRLRFCTLLVFLSAGQILVGLLRGNTCYLKSHFGALRQHLSDRKLILDTRRTLRTLRKRSDREIVAFAVRSQPWSYYKNMVKSS